jgi:short-subunit dehydrogenase
VPALTGHVLLTGAAGAIGTALAHALREAEPSLTLTLTDRASTEPLAQTLGRAHAVQADLLDPDAPARLVETATAKSGPVDLLINCAGVLDFVPVAQAGSWERGRRVLQIDLLAPLELMHRCLPSMRARGGGGVINIASVAALAPMRGGAWYGGAKAGFGMASEAARMELRRDGVHVMTVYPGPILTPLERGGRAQLHESRAAERFPIGEAETLARLIVGGWLGGRARVVYPRAYEVVRLLPWIAGAISDRWGPATRD